MGVDRRTHDREIIHNCLILFVPLDAGVPIIVKSDWRGMLILIYSGLLLISMYPR